MHEKKNKPPSKTQLPPIGSSMKEGSFDLKRIHRPTARQYWESIVPTSPDTATEPVRMPWRASPRTSSIRHFVYPHIDSRRWLDIMSKCV